MTVLIKTQILFPGKGSVYVILTPYCLLSKVCFIWNNHEINVRKKRVRDLALRNAESFFVESFVDVDVDVETLKQRQTLKKLKQ